MTEPDIKVLEMGVDAQFVLTITKGEEGYRLRGDANGMSKSEVREVLGRYLDDLLKAAKAAGEL